MLKQLVFSFDGDGQSFATYEATVALIEAILGKPSREVFADAIDSCDGGFYLNEQESVEKVWDDMLYYAVPCDPKKAMELILHEDKLDSPPVTLTFTVKIGVDCISSCEDAYGNEVAWQPTPEQEAEAKRFAERAVRDTLQKAHMEALWRDEKRNLCITHILISP